MMPARDEGLPHAIGAGDLVEAFGVVPGDEGDLALRFVGAGRYALHPSAWTVGIKSDATLPSGPGTVRGTWDGVRLTRAEAIGRAAPVAPPPSLADHDALPRAGIAVPSRARILREDVLAAADPLRKDALLFFVAHRRPDGWVAVAAAAEPEAVERGLRPLLGDALIVVPSPWTKGDLDAADAALAEPTVEAVTREIGVQISPDGHARHTALLLHAPTSLVETLEALPRGIVAVQTWLQPVAPQG